MMSERPVSAAADTLALLQGSGGVDVTWYRGTYPRIPDTDPEAVVHYLGPGWRAGYDPNPEFSTRGYLRANPDVAASGMNPLVHYLRFGKGEKRDRGLELGVASGNEGIWRRLYDSGLLHLRHGEPAPPGEGPFGRAGHAKIVLAGHEASRSGAPLLLLHLLKHLARRPDVEILLFLERGGTLVEAYRELAHVVINEDHVLNAEGAYPVASLLQNLADPLPHTIILNSCATIGLLKEFLYLGHPPVTLMIHERLFPFSPERRGEIAEACIRIIFPSEAVRQYWIEQDARFESGVTLYHGLIQPDFGLGDRAMARRSVRELLGFPEDARIVLACGARHPGKGFDLFLQIGGQVIAASPEAVHFIWLGGSANDLPPMQQLWAEHDIRELGLGSRLHLVESQVDTEPYYLAADVFLMTSRDDSFPFVVQDAMASRVPVVAFDRAGGAPEALAGDCGIVVPYLSVSAMTRATLELLSDNELRDRIGRTAEDRVRSVYVFRQYVEDIMEIAENDAPASGRSSGESPQAFRP